MLKMMLYLLPGCLLSTAALAQSALSARYLMGHSVPGKTLTAGLARVVYTAHITGLSVLVLDHQRIAYEHYFGTKDSCGRAPFDSLTILYAASLTKPVSAYLFLRLVDQGVFALDTPVYHYLKHLIAEYDKWPDPAREPVRQTLRCPSPRERKHCWRYCKSFLLPYPFLFKAQHPYCSALYAPLAETSTIEQRKANERPLYQLI